METYESDTEGDEQETPLLPGGHEEHFQIARKGIFFIQHAEGKCKQSAVKNKSGFNRASKMK